jgi:predicted nucleotidyltransferase
MAEFCYIWYMKSKTKHIGNLIRQCITSIDPKAEAILYGSRARGDENSDSDWDILILTDYPIYVETEQKFRNRLYDLNWPKEDQLNGELQANWLGVAESGP